MNVLAIICVILKNAIYGISVFFTGELTSSVNIFDILSLRFLLSFSALYIMKSFGIVKIKAGAKDLLIRGENASGKRDLFLAMLFEPVLYMIFETAGIAGTTGITTAVILSLGAVTSCLFEWLILKESTTFLQKVFLGIGALGVIHIAMHTSTNDGENTVYGIVFLVLAVTSGSLFSVFSRKSSLSYSAMDRTYIYCLMGMIAFNFINIARHLFNGTILHYFDPFFNVQNLIGFVFLSVVSAIIATLLNNFALSKIQVTTAGAFGGVSTIVTITSGILFAGEKLYMYHIIGVTLILIRIIGVSVIASRKDKMHNLS